MLLRAVEKLVLLELAVNCSFRNLAVVSFLRLRTLGRREVEALWEISIEQRKSNRPC